MKTIIALLCCLGLIGCATAKGHGPGRPMPKKEVAGVDQKELDDMIFVFSDTIKRSPNYAGAYYNRAIAYYYKKDYDRSWQDVHKVQQLSSEYDEGLAKLIERLQADSGRKK